MQVVVYPQSFWGEQIFIWGLIQILRKFTDRLNMQAKQEYCISVFMQHEL